MVCEFCGNEVSLELLQEDKQSGDGIKKFIVRCPKCCARSKEAYSEEGAIQNWNDRNFTHETMITSRPLPFCETNSGEIKVDGKRYRKNDNPIGPYDIDDDGAVQLVSAVVRQASEDYRVHWQELCRAKDYYEEQKVLHPKLDKKTVELSDNLYSARSKKEKKIAKIKLDMYEAHFSTFFRAKHDYCSARILATRDESWIKETALLGIVGVERELIISSLRIQAEEMDSDVMINYLSDKSVYPELRFVFKNGCYRRFQGKNGNVWVEVADDRDMLILTPADKKGSKTLKLQYHGKNAEFRTKRKDIMEWANGHAPYCRTAYDHLHKRYLIK